MSKRKCYLIIAALWLSAVLVAGLWGPVFYYTL